MRKPAMIVICFLVCVTVRAQIGIGTNAPANAGQLELNSNTKGFLPPRMTTTERDNIVSPVTGLQIFNTTTKCLECYISGVWQPIACGCSAAPASAPNAAIQVGGAGTVVWNWNVVPGATGYKYNTVNNYASAANNGNMISYAQSGLSCSGVPQTLYVWAYNPCGNSPVATLTANLFYPVSVNKTGTGSGTVSAAPAGINCGTACTADYACGSTVTLNAVPDAGSQFNGWSGACSGTGSCVVSVTGAQTVNANFSLNTYSLNVSNTGTGSGTVTSAPAGINCGSTCTALFNSGTLVTLNAVAAGGSTFTGWSGACSGTGSCVVTMNSVQNVSADFAVSTYDLTVTKAGTGGGTVTSAPAGINCGSTCVSTYNAGTTVTLSASPQSGTSFAGWSGACTGTGSCVVTMDAAKSVTATFTQNNYSLNLNKTGTGSGTVSSSPAGISCGSTCSASYSSGTTVTLNAAAAGGSTFTGWSGACSGTGSCVVTMNSDQNVSADFAITTYDLTVTKAGSGGGTVTSAPAGINCGSTCVSTYNAGTTVTLSASPQSGASFTGWSGVCTGTGSCVVTMDAAKTATATFTLNSYALTVSKSGNGTVTSTPAGINCGSTCSSNYNFGTTVTLTAVAGGGSTFTGWSGACSGIGSCTVTMTAAKTVGATFSP